MKASVETLNPTRVTVSVEVPFDELAPAVDNAYKRIARQVKVQGFRPGKVPPRIIDQRVGRAAVLEEALQDAIPRFYAEAITDQSLAVVGRPDVELESFDDGAPLVFKATVDVRPTIELPAYDGLAVTVDDADATDEAVDTQLMGLQDRFATLQGVERSVQDGDFVLLDLRATANNELVEGSEASGLSYEVGSGGLVPGLDDAIRGAAAGEGRTFDADIAYGELAGTPATFDVTVKAVREKQVPPLDDDFAQTASEFDTLAELRDDVRARLERVQRIQQAMQARDKVLEALLAKIEVPLPESMVESEIEWRQRDVEGQLAQAGVTFEQYLDQTDRAKEDVEAEMRQGATEAVKAQLVLDAVGAKEELEVSEADLSDQVVRRATRAGMDPNELAQRIVRGGQLPALMGEIVRGKALAQVLESAVITDESGRPVDLGALRDDAPVATGVEADIDVSAGDEDEEHDHDHDHEGHEHHHH